MNIKDNMDKKEVKKEKIENKSKNEAKITKKTDNSKDKTTKKEEVEKKEPKKVFLVNYYIKDLTLDKIVETNIEDYKHESYAVVFHKGLKPILEGINNVFPKVEEKLKNIKLNEDFTMNLKSEDAYGKRDKKLLKIVPFKVFKENNLKPVVGLTIDTGEGKHGIIKSVSGGRVMVDFNSPYADHDIEFYTKLVETPKGEEKVKHALKGLMPSLATNNVKFNNKEVSIALSKDKYKEEQTKGLDQVLLSVLKQYEDVEKVKVDLK